MSNPLFTVHFADYFHSMSRVDEAIICNAREFLHKVNGLIEMANLGGVVTHMHPVTHTALTTDGCFLPLPESVDVLCQRFGRGCVVYDPNGELRDWCIGHEQQVRFAGLRAVRLMDSIGLTDKFL